jgi:hypothetical protein
VLCSHLFLHFVYNSVNLRYLSVHFSGCLDQNWLFGVGALWFYALDSPMTGAIAVTTTSIVDSPFEAIHFIGSSITGVHFDGVTVSNVSTFVFQVLHHRCTVGAIVLYMAPSFLAHFRFSQMGPAQPKVLLLLE